MLEVHIPSVGPEAEDPRQSPEKGHMIKKLYKVPDFPSKRLPNWRTRGLEQRRQGLEAYIQGVLYLNQDVPKELLEFLSLRHFSTDPKASNWGALGEFLPKNSRQVEAPPPRPQFPARLRLPPSGLVPAGVWPLPAVQVSLLVPPETTSHSPSLFGCLVILIPSLHLIGDPAPASPLLPLL
uniref:Sorting nexin 22 n=1 Tax=Lynx canadensis TaxID=61383 RepID=A0A667FX11_LYNCA